MTRETYQTELNDVRQALLDRQDQYITFKELVERFDEISEEYPDNPWNLLQIYSNFNILIGGCQSQNVDVDSLINKIEIEMSWYMFDEWGNTTSLHDELVDIIRKWAESDTNRKE